MFIRPEITAEEKFVLGKLMAAYATNADYSPPPSSPERALLDRMVGAWVERTGVGSYKITNYGMNALSTSKVVRRRT